MRQRSSAKSEKATERLAVYSFRLPKPPAVDEFFGNSRTAWNELILPTKANKGKPAVKSFVVKQPGTSRGRRYILYSSALEYFQRLAAESEKAATSEVSA